MVVSYYDILYRYYYYIGDSILTNGGIEMKNKFLSLVLAVVLCFSMTVTAFAAEIHLENATVVPMDTDSTIVLDTTLQSNAYSLVTMEENDSVNTSDVVTRASTAVVPSNGSIDMYPTLLSYTGFTRKFYVSTESESTMGALLLYLYNPNGKLVSEDWIMSVNGAYEWSLFLPSSGQWHLWVVAQGTTADVNIQAKWINS